jgi:hypothetical protein
VSFDQLRPQGKGAGNQSLSRLTKPGLCPRFVDKILVEVDA